MLLAGCDHREIVCPDGDGAHVVNIAFSWEHAEQADPKGMSVYFFEDGGKGGARRFDIGGRSGGSVELPAGRYSMIAVNNDLPGVRIDDYESSRSISAAAQSADDGGAGGMTRVKPTGMLYGGQVNEIDVTMCGVSYLLPDGSVKHCPKGLIRCAPDSLAKEYRVIFRGVDGIERIKSASASIAGISSRLRLCDRETGGELCRVALPLDKGAGGAATLAGSTTGFGVPSGIEPDVALTLYVTLNSGKKCSKTFDISSQVKNFLHRNSILIIIEGLSIPDDEPIGPPDNPEGGFDADVSDWNTVEIELS